MIALWLRADRAARKEELAKQRLLDEAAKKAVVEPDAAGKIVNKNNGWGAGRMNSHFA